jgi:hypothetical protein
VSFTELLVNPMSVASIGEIIEGSPPSPTSSSNPAGSAMLQVTEVEGALPPSPSPCVNCGASHRDRLMLREYRGQLGGLTGPARAAEACCRPTGHVGP